MTGALIVNGSILGSDNLLLYICMHIGIYDEYKLVHVPACQDIHWSFFWLRGINMDKYIIIY